jgi:hypothetical protein
MLKITGSGISFSKIEYFHMKVILLSYINYVLWSRKNLSDDFDGPGIGQMRLIDTFARCDCPHNPTANEQTHCHIASCNADECTIWILEKKRIQVFTAMVPGHPPACSSDYRNPTADRHWIRMVYLSVSRERILSRTTGWITSSESSAPPLPPGILLPCNGFDSMQGVTRGSSQAT